jgi:prepilin-type processing-associated H-X9-DG protein
MSRKQILGISLAVVTLAVGLLQHQVLAQSGEAVEKGKFDVGYIPPSAVAVVAAYPRSVLMSKDMELVPREILTAGGLRDFGVDPVDIEQIMAVAEPPVGGPPQAAVVARFSKPLASGKILPMLASQTTEADLGGKTYRKGNNPMAASIYQVDEQTLIVGTDNLLRKMVANHAAPQSGKLSQMMSHVGTPDIVAIVLVEPLRPIIAQEMPPSQVPPPFAALTKVPDLVQYIAAKVDLTGDMNMALTIRANDETAAEQLESIIVAGMTIGRQAALQQVSRQAASSDPVDKASAQYMRRVTDRVCQMLTPVRKGATLTLAGSGKAYSQLAVPGVLLGLLMPAVQSARAAGRSASSANNLHQIALAAQNYLATFNALPPRARFSKDGKPLLSWRVLILPFIEEDALYRKFHLDEPWDSPNNRALIPMMPKCYASPTMPQAGKTPYLAVCGKGLMFDGDKGRRPVDITDGMSNTIMFIESQPAQEVIWTKPDDWEFNEQQPLAGLGAQPGRFNAAFADGSVRRIPTTIDPATLKALLTIAGGEAVPPGSFY